jgi:hypothetical protein
MLREETFMAFCAYFRTPELLGEFLVKVMNSGCGELQKEVSIVLCRKKM